MSIVHNGDCLKIMPKLKDKSVNMILCDLPYGTTACTWDAIIPFDKLWKQYERLIKDNGCIALFGQEPFSSHLRMSNLKLYKYDWIWIKSRACGFYNVKHRPMNSHELISIFSKATTRSNSEGTMKFYPQGLKKLDKVVSGIKDCQADRAGHKFSRLANKAKYIQKYTNYPTKILKFSNVPSPVHPTQKPISLLEYLIRTYTEVDDTVLDNTMGSGSTGVASVNLNRRFIGIEKDKTYYKIAQDRLKLASKNKEINKNKFLEELNLEG